VVQVNGTTVPADAASIKLDPNRPGARVVPIAWLSRWAAHCRVEAVVLPAFEEQETAAVRPPG
jgi:hypothetical protein